MKCAWTFKLTLSRAGSGNLTERERKGMRTKPMMKKMKMRTMKKKKN